MKNINKSELLKLQTEKDLNLLRSKPVEIADLVAGYRKRRETINGDKRLSNSYRQKLLDQALEATKTELEKHKNESTEAASRLAGVIQEFQHEPVDPQQAILSELQGQRVWNRISRLLDAGADWGQVINDNKTDLATLQVLKAELPAYVASKDRKTPDISQNIITEIEAKELPLLPSHKQQARLLETELSVGVYQLNLGIIYIQSELLAGGKPNPNLPAWEKGKVIPVVALGASINSDDDLVGVE